jgi:uncharacterized protein YbjT (DUF2867 family)
MILVTGATGTAGSEVVRALAARRRPVRALVRDRARAERLLGTAAELAVGALGDPASVHAALRDCDALVLSCADDPRRVDWEKGAIAAAAAAGVRRIVKLSAINAVPGAPVAFWDWHGQVEHELGRARVPSVILRSSFYMSNLLAAAGAVAQTGRLFAPAGAARIAMIDPRDVGAAAAAVATSPDHDGRTYVLTGPAAIDYVDVARALAAATGREIAYVDVPDAAAHAQLVEDGMPAFAADQVVRLYERLRAGAAEQVTTALPQLTGRPARDIDQFARDHAHRFAPAPVGAAQ